MKTSDLKKMLKEKSNNFEIKNYTNEILNKANYIIKEEVKEKPRHKLRIVALSSFSIALTACFIFLATVILTGNVTIEPTVLHLSKDEKIFSKEVFALGNIVSDLNLEESVKTGFNIRLANVVDKEIKTENDCLKIAKNVNQYLFTGNALIKNDLIDISYENNKDEKFSDYKFKLIVSFTDRRSFENKYIAYYNEESKDKKVIFIKGIILVDNNSYEIEGKKETNEEEVESHLSIRTGLTTYITVENETEVNENEYIYEYYEHNKLIKRVKMEIENEDGMQNTEIEIEENGLIYNYEFEYLDETIECEYSHYDAKTDTEIEIEIIIYNHDTYFLYIFEDGMKIRLDK